MLNYLVNAMKILYGVTQTAAEAMQDASLLVAPALFIEDKEETNDDMTMLTWGTLVLTVSAAIPLTATIMHHWFKPSEHEHEHEGHEAHHDHEGHHHSIYHTMGEVLVIGVPFGLLGFAGANNVLNKLDKSLRYPISGILALVNGLGNYKLHSHHIHAEESYWTLLKRIPKEQLCKALYISLVIGISHLFQGFLAGNLFLESIQVTNEVAKITVPVVLAILVTIFEGNTEMRSSLQQMLGDDAYRNLPWQSKAATMPAAAIHGMIPTVGLIEFLRFVYTQITQEELADHLPLYGRILVFAASFLTVWYPNARGFYSTTLPATNQVLTKALPCLFRNRSNEHERLVDDNDSNIVPDSHVITV